MDSYEIEWKRSAVKELKQLPKEMIARILQAVESLADDPVPVTRRNWLVRNTPTAFAKAITA